MKQLYISFLLIFLGTVFQTKAQQGNDRVAPLDKLKADTAATFNVLDKKSYWGLVFVNSWTSITDDPAHFYKPSLGGGVRADYYITNTLGISAGLNYQQRGTGVFTPDVDKSLGNPDSTHRLRLRFNCLDLPLAVVYRSPKGILGGNGVRLFLSAGATPHFNFQTKRIFFSVEDGFHDIQDVSGDYYDVDVSLDGSLGFLISAGGSSVFLVNALAQYGSRNVYKSISASGQNRLFGLRIAWLY